MGSEDIDRLPVKLTSGLEIEKLIERRSATLTRTSADQEKTFKLYTM